MGSQGSKSFHRAPVYLVRHGQTPLNAADLIRGRLDEPLDDTGERQAQALGRLFRGVAIARVITSPLQRARRTGAPIAATAAGVEVEVDAGLNDRDYGKWAGAPRAEVVRQFGSLDAAPGVEPWAILTDRILSTFEAIVADMGRRAIVIVAHDAVNRALLNALVPELAESPDLISQRNGCWNRLERTQQGWRIAVLDAIPGDGHEP